MLMGGQIQYGLIGRYEYRGNRGLCGNVGTENWV